MSGSVTTGRNSGLDAEGGRELGCEELELGMSDDATPEQLERLLVGLRRLRDRVDRGQLEPGDSALLSVLLRNVT